MSAFGRNSDLQIKRCCRKFDGFSFPFTIPALHASANSDVQALPAEDDGAGENSPAAKAGLVVKINERNWFR